MWSRPGISKPSASGIMAASGAAGPPISSFVPTATSVGCVIRAICAGVSSCREVAMQAASARRSLFVWSAKARNIFPRGCVIVAGSAAASASAIGSQSPTPSTMPIPSPPKIRLATRAGSASAMKAATRAPIE